MLNKVKKCVYLYSQFKLNDVQKRVKEINEDRNLAKAVRLLLAYFEEKELLNSGTIEQLRKRIKIKRTDVSNYVPNDKEMIETLITLSHNKDFYTYFLTLMFSGIRVVELKYLIDHFENLRKIEFESFVKIQVNYFRNTKKSFLFIYQKKYYLLDETIKNNPRNVRALQTYQKKHRRG